MKDNGSLSGSFHHVSIGLVCENKRTHVEDSKRNAGSNPPFVQPSPVNPPAPKNPIETRWQYQTVLGWASYS